MKHPGVRVLVVGGAGYIGSHMVKALHRAGHEPTTLDNLSTGHRDAVKYGRFIHGDLLDAGALSRVLCEGRFDAVMHFAALANVGESVTDPRRYYTNNVVGTLHLLDAMLDAGVRRLVFSSTCATYGNPAEVPITEREPQSPINPYGRSKLVVEQCLGDYAAAHALDSVSLRYFNAAGADRDGELSERHDPEPHLIPRALGVAERTRQEDGAGEVLEIFGDDYPTPDGTCVRDYVHVEDLCAAHLLALERMLARSGLGAESYNLGTSHGASVNEIVAACSGVTGVEIPVRVAPRRPGDPPMLVASSDRARQVLGWTPAITDLREIIRTAWQARRP